MSELITFPGCKPPEALRREPALVEPAIAPEFVATELSQVKTFGSITRLVFSCLDTAVEDPEGSPHKGVVLKLVVPTDALPAIHAALASRLPAQAAE